MSVTNRVAEKVRQAAGRRMGPDGIVRKAEDEEELDRLAAFTFKEAAAQKFLSYLKSITINNTLGPGASNEELRHLEGQRNLVGIIERRIDNGRRQS